MPVKKKWVKNIERTCFNCKHFGDVRNTGGSKGTRIHEQDYEHNIVENTIKA
jgi:hypothetical protein